MFNKIAVFGKYLAIPVYYLNKENRESSVCLFIPKDFITGKYPEPLGKDPENFFGVNLKAFLEDIEDRNES